jgi:hypothetical protein
MEPPHYATFAGEYPPSEPSSNGLGLAFRQKSNGDELPPATVWDVGAEAFRFLWSASRWRNEHCGAQAGVGLWGSRSSGPSPLRSLWVSLSHWS